MLHFWHVVCFLSVMMNAQITIKRGLSLFLLVFLASPGNLRAQSGWTVDDCMRYAVEQNYRVRNSRLDTRIAGEDLTAAYGDFLPSVSATGALGKRLGRSVDPKTNLYTSSSFLESTMGLNVSLPVFDGFTRVNRLQFRKLNKQIGGLTEQIEENRIAFEVMDAFYRLCFDKKMYELAVEQRKLSERYHEQMLEYVDLGMRSPSDLQEVKARLDRGDQWVIRFRMPENETVAMDDLIRGHVEVNTSTLDDKVLYKSADALPTYHLANIVDDRLMEVSHVIRGEEWLPSLPLHYLLYKAFGWTDVQPRFAHLPLLLKPTGGGKLSKRDGDKMGFPVFPLFWTSPTGETAHGYREDGYFPEAFINMLALLGWNPGTEQEIFSMQELIDSFSLDRVSKSGARFQPDKARWFNAQYMHHKTDAELAALYQPVLRSHGIEVSDAVAGKAAGIMKERATFTTDLWDLTSFFFEAPREYEEKQVRKYWKGQNPAILRELRDVLAGIDDFSLENTERIVHAWIEEKGYGMGQVMNTLRLALVGAGKGPGMYDVTSFIGKEECLKRIDNLLTNLKPAIE